MNTTDPAIQEQLHQEYQKLLDITVQINTGKSLAEILEKVYQEFHELVPYNRIGLSLIDPDGETIRAVWAKSDREKLLLGANYTGKLAGSSLETILRTRQPRILNDLPAYLEQKPASDSTRLIVEEGMLASLTCPLLIADRPVGFLFFSSAERDAYTNDHVEVIQRIADQLAVIVEKGRMIDTLEEQKLELERLNKLRVTYIGMAVHDLRNPVAYMKLAANVLEKISPAPMDEESARILKTISHHADEMLGLLNSLLDVSQLDAGFFRVQPRPTELKRILVSAVERNLLFAEARKIKTELTGSLEGLVLADSERIKQVMDNLLSNAYKYSPVGGTVRIQTIHQPENVRIEVRDFGPGIPLEEQPRLFIEFERISTSRMTAEKSTGLGLAICRKIIEGHKGQIGVESSPGSGTSFWFTLKRAA